ncbi:MAG: Phospho-2-dehydro-3-deoxyheptonate aldolase [Candidatus Parcubacteria bacterium]
MTENTLVQLRTSIDQADVSLVLALAQRMEYVREVGKHKRNNSIPALDEGRWNEVLAKVVALGKQSGLSEEFVKDIYAAIHEESLRIETGDN